MFKNRKEAAIELAKELEIFKPRTPLILAIPRGGVEIGYYIARELSCEWSVLVARKLGYPEQPEAAFGAMAEDKSLYFNPRANIRLSKEMIERVIKKEEKEILRRIKIYRNGAPLPSMNNRTVVLVDDGIATGATLFASIEMCKKARAGEIIVAAPVASIDVCEQLMDIVDMVVVLETPLNFFAVSQAYLHFENLSDKDVLKFLSVENILKNKSNKLVEY
ncbi:MAG: phosphoribosyltransferase [Gracilimonas sp.]|uniref:phosphoribosyltransferase n=1 Tax=Gracilimonas sp. TaxID=1974203 RepID=UPI00198A6DBA|nr:phosphoribosyltransferase family protein [Gracilimonas sp.]MBD3616296.1 phosphoribosyltransferase [Gracilimonas sp.]